MSSGNQKKLTVVAADRIGDGVLIYFSDGTSSVFADEFLYRHRASEGNTPSSEEIEMDDAGSGDEG